MIDFFLGFFYGELTILHWFTLFLISATLAYSMLMNPDAYAQLLVALGLLIVWGLLSGLKQTIKFFQWCSRKLGYSGTTGNKIIKALTFEDLGSESDTKESPGSVARCGSSGKSTTTYLAPQAYEDSLLPEQILADPSASTWIKYALSEALTRDPIDAANDAMVLARCLNSRTDRP